MPKELILSGRVQGVFCRDYCRQNARRLGLRGSASNLANGSVRVLLDCDDERVDEYVRALRGNPFGFRFHGRISDITVTEYRGGMGGDYVF
ncbi:MAG TPA: acylphosphatase [Spirochaetota bacterium]|nr:acylphosphatase [Spirochaetota bacterium]HNT12358.1 acylphosphatase [Spirochaetota bacterium]HNV46233.1 acylphosphatase [Spirochaetota bacterium]HPI22322.1 acylphosphatase [Spirochaetota bacterium]HPU87834.1 acylphosphatase [Spirochaetota bacterium]